MHSKVCCRGLMWSVTSAQRRFGDPQQTPGSGAAGIARSNKTYKVFAVCRAAGVCLVKPDWYCGVKFKGPVEFHLSCFSRLVESSRKIKGRKFPALELPLQAVGGTKRLYWAWAASRRLIRSSLTAEKQLIVKYFTMSDISNMGKFVEASERLCLCWCAASLWFLIPPPTASRWCHSEWWCVQQPLRHIKACEMHRDILF